MPHLAMYHYQNCERSPWPFQKNIFRWTRNIGADVAILDTVRWTLAVLVVSTPKTYYGFVVCATFALVVHCLWLI